MLLLYSIHGGTEGCRGTVCYEKSTLGGDTLRWCDAFATIICHDACLEALSESVLHTGVLDQCSATLDKALSMVCHMEVG